MSNQSWWRLGLATSLLGVVAAFVFWRASEPPAQNEKLAQTVLPPAIKPITKKITSADRFKTESEKTVRPVTPIDPSSIDYVGSMACRECHPEIWEKYQSHPMANSFAKVASAGPFEDYTNQAEFGPPGSRRYRVERNGDEVFHHEIMRDQTGAAIYDQSVPVSFVLGSGKRGRAYLIDREGLMFKSSLSWYSKEHKWGLSPDYLPKSHLRFERRVTGGCISCHSGRPNFVRNEADRFGEPPFLEESISCERCHGPGRKHIAARVSGDLADDSIVNPAHLDVDRREAVCAQCHLHGESRTLRTDRTPHDFQPGQRLEENWLVLVKSHGSGLSRSGRAASQVEHMVSSVCFRQSEGRMGCISCHDPHSVPTPQEKYESYRQKCLKCHADRGCALPVTERDSAPDFDRCTVCHMPATESTNVLHRSIADHRILRKPLTDIPESGETRIFQFTEGPIPELERQRARAFIMVRDAAVPPLNPELARQAYQLLLKLIAESPNDPELYFAIANSCQIQNQFKESVRWRMQLLQLNPRHEATVQSLATMFHDQLQPVPAENYLKQFLQLNPWLGSYHGRLALTLKYRGDNAGAIASAERALELNPTLQELHPFLADVYHQVGDPKAAEKHQALLERFPPRERPATKTGSASPR